MPLRGDGVANNEAASAANIAHAWERSAFEHRSLCCLNRQALNHCDRCPIFLYCCAVLNEAWASHGYRVILSCFGAFPQDAR